jgi:hypothetical protein
MDDSTLSEILSTASHVSGEQIGKMLWLIGQIGKIWFRMGCKEMIIDFRT